MCATYLILPDRVSRMPIHVRAEQGEYAEACLLPGDPLRAKYIAETYLDDVVQRNSERGLLGYTGTYQGKPVSVQGTGMGCPGATIVFEELIQLGVEKLLRVRQCRRVPRPPARAGAARPDRERGADPRSRPRGQAHGPVDARRPDRLERRLLQPRREP